MEMDETALKLLRGKRLTGVEFNDVNEELYLKFQGSATLKIYVQRNTIDGIDCLWFEVEVA